MEIWPRSIFCWAEGSNVLPKALNSKLHTIRQHFIDVHIIFDASRMFHSDRSVCSRHWRYSWAWSDSWSCCVQGTCWWGQVGGRFLGSVPGLRALHSLHLLLELRDGELGQFSLLVYNIKNWRQFCSTSMTFGRLRWAVTWRKPYMSASAVGGQPGT